MRLWELPALSTLYHIFLLPSFLPSSAFLSKLKAALFLLVGVCVCVASQPVLFVVVLLAEFHFNNNNNTAQHSRTGDRQQTLSRRIFEKVFLVFLFFILENVNAAASVAENVCQWSVCSRVSWWSFHHPQFNRDREKRRWNIPFFFFFSIFILALDAYVFGNDKW